MARTLRSNGPGHNSAGMIDGAGLKRFVDRGVACVEARKAANEDYALVIEEAKEAGFVGKQVRALVREAMMEPHVLEDSLSQMDALRHALGQFATTPLGEAAVEATTSKRRRSKAETALDKAEAHIYGGGDPDEFSSGAASSPYEDEDPAPAA